MDQSIRRFLVSQLQHLPVPFGFWRRPPCHRLIASAHEPVRQRHKCTVAWLALSVTFRDCVASLASTVVSLVGLIIPRRFDDVLIGESLFSGILSLSVSVSLAGHFLLSLIYNQLILTIWFFWQCRELPKLQDQNGSG